MKRVIIEIILSVIFYTLLAWVLSGAAQMFRAIVQFEETDWSQGGEFYFTFNLIPFFILGLFSIFYAFYSFKTRSTNKRTLKWMFTSMTEYSEGDERESIITSKATRAGYYTYGVTVPIFMIILVFSPFFNEHFPSYPFYTLAAILNISTIVYGVVWVREYRK
ncbi:hypothetical protein [Jeotgalibacillus campisalis]|uniref:Uncharacterized protein n=1 Tax=Jeotgalibacillus campisalis TaxID=220754 RepID=A0A0C2SAS3_9BACL|nr:hypothetical protein [Jeotgalibacillus campisalis]KIL51024.1 hypothetical protein KR50_09050 [Jeotgalibacillus campisalis]